MAQWEKPKVRVCVIGAGAAGLCSLRHLSSDSQSYEPAAFEQTNDVGGTWTYQENTGLDENGYAIHSSMYQNLRTNLPVRIMNFPDYQKMGRTSDEACGGHRQVLQYLRDYADNYQLRQYINFNTRVECVKPSANEDDWKKTIWKVRVKKIKTGEIEDKEYDAVVVCNGHYFEPNIPNIPGIETFTGTVMHSHDYRKPERFLGKRVLVLGAASSGIDISLELCGEASHVNLSHNHDRLIGPLPSNMTQVAGVERILGSDFILRDGTIVQVDSFIYCTGYKYSYPFLDDTCAIRVDENYVSPLYKHLINIQHPTMCIIGVPLTVIPFPMFHMQIQYFLAILKGRAALPGKIEMLEDSICKSANKRHAHVLANRQFDYNDHLAISGAFERLPEFYKNGYAAWNRAKIGNLLNYKNSKFIISSDNIHTEVIQQSP